MTAPPNPNTQGAVDPSAASSDSLEGQQQRMREAVAAAAVTAATTVATSQPPTLHIPSQTHAPQPGTSPAPSTTSVAAAPAAPHPYAQYAPLHHPAFTQQHLHQLVAAAAGDQMMSQQAAEAVAANAAHVQPALMTILGTGSVGARAVAVSGSAPAPAAGAEAVPTHVKSVAPPRSSSTSATSGSSGVARSGDPTSSTANSDGSATGGSTGGGANSTSGRGVTTPVAPSGVRASSSSSSKSTTKGSTASAEDDEVAGKSRTPSNRGRPRKTPIPLPQTQTTTDSAATMYSAPYLTAAQIVAISELNAQPPTPASGSPGSAVTTPRPRGRPRIHPKIDESERRPRGRPRKDGGPPRSSGFTPPQQSGTALSLNTPAGVLGRPNVKPIMDGEQSQDVAAAAAAAAVAAAAAAAAQDVVGSASRVVPSLMPAALSALGGSIHAHALHALPAHLAEYHQQLKRVKIDNPADGLAAGHTFPASVPPSMSEDVDLSMMNQSMEDASTTPDKNGTAGKQHAFPVLPPMHIMGTGAGQPGPQVDPDQVAAFAATVGAVNFAGMSAQRLNTSVPTVPTLGNVPGESNKRPRGRPRIHPLPSADAVKRPRGRPRKSQPPESIGHRDSDTATFAATMNDGEQKSGFLVAASMAAATAACMNPNGTASTQPSLAGMNAHAAVDSGGKGQSSSSSSGSGSSNDSSANAASATRDTNTNRNLSSSGSTDSSGSSNTSANDNSTSSSGINRTSDGIGSDGSSNGHNGSATDSSNSGSTIRSSTSSSNTSNTNGNDGANSSVVTAEASTLDVSLMSIDNSGDAETEIRTVG